MGRPGYLTRLVLVSFSIMTRRRFYAPPETFAADAKSVTLGAEETRHLRGVLRLKEGAEVYVFDGTGGEFRGEVRKVARDSTEVNLNEEVAPARPESPLGLTLAVALLKGEKFDLVLQKATELGADPMIPIMTARADVRIKSDDDVTRKLVRWRRIALEATKQCGRARLMRIEMPMAFAKLIDQPASGGETRFMFAERDGVSFEAAVSDSTKKADRVIALVGSEGGFSDGEIVQARESGWKIVTLGGRVMRAETAAIAIAALLQHRFGDLK